jgi:hypothetical protein
MELRSGTKSEIEQVFLFRKSKIKNLKSEIERCYYD